MASNVTTDETQHFVDNAGKENGNSPFEVFALMFVTPTVFILPSILSCFSSKFRYFKNIFVLNACLLLVLTVLNFIFYFLFIFFILIFINSLRYAWKQINNSLKSTKKLTWKMLLDMNVTLSNGKAPYLDDLRGHLLHTTALCILAVDFQIFPSKFSKTATYGYSIMDVGVGMFVAIHALFGPEAKGRSPSLRKSASASIGLFVIGMLRLVAVTAVGYHTAVSEYGVHWNFFFTLSLTKMSSACLGVYFPRLRSWCLAVGLAIAHQLLLSKYGLTEYVLQEQRYTLLDKNKEGIISAIGFIIIYLGSVEIGKLIWRPRKKIGHYINLLGTLLALWIMGVFVTFVMHNFIQPTSRRMANSTYCVWVVSLLCLQIAIHLFHYVIFILCATARKIATAKSENLTVTARIDSYFLWKAINYNGLFHFLLANILTGLTNLSINTSKASAVVSYSVLLLYISVLTEIITRLYNSAVKIKL